MKKIYTLIMIVAPFFCIAQSQSKLSVGALTPVNVSTSYKNGNPSPLAIDTLQPPVFTMACFTGDASPLVYYTLGSAGFLAGTNSYAETECAQRYSFTGTGTISEVLIEYGHTHGTAGTTSAKVYSIDATPQKKPMTAMGTSNIVTIATIPATGFTTYSFTPTVSVTTNFAVSCVLPTTAAAGDSVVVVSTKENCHSTDSLSYLSIPQFGGWNSVAALLNVKNPYDTSIDLVILPVVNVANGVNEYPSSRGLTLMGAYPNPAQDFTNIRFRTDESSNVSIEVFDLSGRVLQHSSEKLIAGTHDIKVSLKDVAAGNYYYTVKTGSAQLTSKFIVTK